MILKKNCDLQIAMNLNVYVDSNFEYIKVIMP